MSFGSLELVGGVPRYSITLYRECGYIAPQIEDGGVDHGFQGNGTVNEFS